MYQFFVEPHQIADNRITITGGDVNHIKNVLRMKVGDELAVKSGTDDKEYRCGILEFLPDSIVCELRFVKENGVELPSPITLYQGIPKGDKMDKIVREAVELGAVRIVPVQMKRCVVKLDQKKAAARTQRWQAIAEAAAKQSRRAVVPKVALPVSFEEALQEAAGADVPLFPYEMAEDISYTRAVVRDIKPGQSVAVMIGPEGGFAEEEASRAEQKGMKKITLGRRILRTETAPTAMLSVLMYELEAEKKKE